MRHPLTDDYRRGRERLLTLAAELTDGDGAIRSTACPDWTVKDLYAHLAGISTDILSGNTSEAATPGWADGHVADRRDRSLGEVVAEWTQAGAEVSTVMEEFGDPFPLQLFVDQWTHEWDIRSALGERAAAVPENSVYEHYFDEFAAIIGRDAEPGLPRLVVDVDGRDLVIGDGPDIGRLPMSMFEFARITMGRRSASQLAELAWPVAETGPYVEVLVRWSVADRDVIDPVRA